MNKLSTNNYINEIKKIKNKIGNEDRILRLDNPLKKSITVSKSEVIIFTLVVTQVTTSITKKLEKSTVLSIWFSWTVVNIMNVGGRCTTCLKKQSKDL